MRRGTDKTIIILPFSSSFMLHFSSS
jgi:hypothetical protein